MRSCSGGCAWLLRGVGGLGGGLHGFSGGACVVFSGGHVCFFQGGMRGFFPGGMRGFFWGACMVFFRGGMHGLFPGACMVFSGGHAWFFLGGGACVGYDDIRSMSGRYASYWNAFLFVVFFQFHAVLGKKWPK